jgi:2'-5' RNA ligase
MTFSAFDHEDIYPEVGIDLYSLDAIMLDVANIPVSAYIDGPDELFFGTTHKTRYAQGAVAETSAHLTLHQGILETVPAAHVDRVLEGWTPEPVTVERIHVFPTPEFSCVVAKLVVTANLEEGHDRLRLLPHIDCFPAYTPHVTLAYIQPGEHTAARWIAALAPLTGQTFEVTGRYIPA